MNATITIKVRRTKTFNDISIQTERIISLYDKGYGSKRMFAKVDAIFMRLLTKNGY